MKLKLVSGVRTTAIIALVCGVAVACGDNTSGSEVGVGGTAGTKTTGGRGGIDLSEGGEGVGLGGDGMGAGFAGAPCGATRLVAEPPQVNVLLVVDKSGSMDHTPAGFDSDKWSALRGALADTFQLTQDKIAFGLDLYPYSGTSGQPLPANDDCSVPAGSDVVVSVQAGAKASPKILAALDANPPGGGTPTASALIRALAYFTDGAGKALPGEKHVLLATDGGPNCNPNLTCTAATCTVNLDQSVASPNLCDPALEADGPLKCLDEAASVAAVAALTKNGIKTFVIGIPGTEAYADTLDLLAAKSGISNPDAPPAYFAVSAEGGVAGLSDVLERVTTGLITSCRLQLEEVPPVEEELFVVIDGVLIEKGGADGWDYVAGASPPLIQISGKTCEQLESQGAEEINITYGCPIIKPR